MGSNSLVVVSVVAEDGSEVTNNVDDEEDGTFLGPHGQVASFSVTLDWVLRGRFDQGVEDCAGATEDAVGRIGGEGEDQNDDEQHQGVDVVRQESRFNASEHGVDDDS